MGVAQEVARLRGSLDWSEYPASKNARVQFESLVKQQTRKGHVVPNEKLVTIEVGEGLMIINAAFGTKANETMARLISSLLMARLGESVGIRIDPYRIILDLPRTLKGDLVREILMTTDMSCSTKTMVRFHALFNSIKNRTISSFSSSVIPAKGSSSTRSLGSSARARPSSTRFRIP